MSKYLPESQKIRVTQTFAQPSGASLESFEQVLILIPEKANARTWKSIPDANRLKTLFKRLPGSSSRILRGHLSNKNHSGVVLASLGSSEWPDTFSLLTRARTLVTEALSTKPKSLAIITAGFSELQNSQLQEAIILATLAVDFAMPAFQSGKKTSAPLKKLTIFGKRNSKMIKRAIAEADALNLARWLTALPPNKLNTGEYRKIIQALAKENGWQMHFMNEAELKKAKAGAFLAVSQGNKKSDAGIAVLRYRPGKKTSSPDLSLIGKGIIFDTGGTNLKPFKAMLDMHEDMNGSAVALGTLLALTRLKAPIAADCWLAITENRISATAYKSRDVVTASNGTTIEVIHTDAEGRMALADTLALAGKKKPALMMDFATLTGTCVSALTERYSGVFTNREKLNSLMIEAGRDSGERVWPFPMNEDFDEDLKSGVADVLQCAAAGGGDHIQAARFLQRFVPEKSAWIHMDLSAAARKGGLAQVPSGPTGFGVRYALNLILDKNVLKQLKK